MSVDVESVDVLHPNVAVLLWRAAATAGTQPAVVEREITTTYAALLARAQAIATALLASGVAPGDRVVLLLERGADAVAAYFGTLATGAIAVLATETLKPRQIEHILAHSGARYLISAGEFLARKPRPLHSEACLVDIEAIGPGDGGLQPIRRVGRCRANRLQPRDPPA